MDGDDKAQPTKDSTCLIGIQNILVKYYIIDVQLSYHWHVLGEKRKYPVLLRIRVIINSLEKETNGSLDQKQTTAKIFNLNFHPLEVVSRRDPQL